MVKRLSEREHTYNELVDVVDNLVDVVSYLTIKIHDMNLKEKNNERS